MKDATLFRSALAVAATAVLSITAAAAQPPQGRGADTDGDGQVTRAEAEARAAERFDQSDADNDGFVTRDEAAQARKARMQERMEARKNAERGERGERGERRRGGGDRGWAKMDTDQDERLSRDEMMAGATDRFDKADANNDGVITKEEMRETRGKRGGKHRKEKSADE